MMIRKDPSPLKRRKSKMNMMLFTSINGDKRNVTFNKDFDKGSNLFEAFQNDSISERD